MMLSLHLPPCFSLSPWRTGFERLKKVFVTPIIVRLTFELNFLEISYINMHVSFTLLICLFFCCSLTNPLHPFCNSLNVSHSLWISFIVYNSAFSSLCITLGLPQALWPPPKWPPLFQPGPSTPVPAPLQPALCPPPHAQLALSTSTLIFDQSQLLSLSPADHHHHHLLKARSPMSVRPSWFVESSGPPRREEKLWIDRVPKDL